MTDREKIINAMECHKNKKVCMNHCPYCDGTGDFEECTNKLITDALALLKEQEGLLGIQQTADGITFISTGTAQQGENRGLLLGKYAMHEWLEKELLYRGLLTDDIRAVFDEAKLWGGR